MTTLDHFLTAKDRRPNYLAEQKRRKAEIEARRPAEIPEDLLLLEDEREFCDAYRARYRVNPRGIEFGIWHRAEKLRKRRR
jgi:hypothetical protein